MTLDKIEIDEVITDILILNALFWPMFGKTRWAKKLIPRLRSIVVIGGRYYLCDFGRL